MPGVLSITVSDQTWLSLSLDVSTRNEFSNHSEYPSVTQTRATNILACFGDMLTAYRTNGNTLNPLRLAVIDVKDATNVSSTSYPDSEIPNNFTDIFDTFLLTDLFNSSHHSLIEMNIFKLIKE